MIPIVFRSNPHKPSTGSETLLLIARGVSYHFTIHSHAWRPPTDIYETEDKIVVLIEVAGMHEKDFVVSLDRNRLSVSGVRSQPLDERRAVHQMEIPFGEFATEVEILTPIDWDKVTATYENGFLRIELPKRQPKSIEITTEG
ncbi:Hsp20/alpha crystallin family protein [uncultured Thermanaerothrix sp.]|uniref:Hsp20/alpha crystallin family protein n=1 Tax=uncultured Thermanaerothrix sp. TaxID=1195149 RepID=UPI002638BB51|nr:Hsp20/alpha crystallin family protein [uncultured Thermanaerothrix sp.]